MMNHSGEMDGGHRHGGSFGCGDFSRMDRLDYALPQRYSAMQPRMQSTSGGNPLDLTSAIAHELQRPSFQQAGWLSWQQKYAANQAQDLAEPFSPYSSLTPQQHSSDPNGLMVPCIPRFDDAGMSYAKDALEALPQMPLNNFDYEMMTGSLSGAHFGFQSRTVSLPTNADLRVRDDAPFLNPVQNMDTVQRLDAAGSISGSSPWIERMMQADVTPTPCPSLCTSTSPTLVKRAGTDASCVLSQNFDIQSCHSNDIQRSEKSLRSAFHSDQHQESTVDTDLCSDDDDLETTPVDEKRKKRMLSNRASAQRSRRRRQERLDQLEVLTAQLRVENSSLRKSLTSQTQLTKKFEEENKQLQMKLEKMTLNLEAKLANLLPKPVATVDDCVSSQQTMCAGSSEMVGGQLSAPSLNHEAGTLDDGVSAPPPSVSEGSREAPSGAELNKTRKPVDIVTRSSGSMRTFSTTATASKSVPSLVGKKRALDQPTSDFGRVHSLAIGSHMSNGPGNGGFSQHASLRTHFVEGCSLLEHPNELPSQEACDSFEFDDIEEKSRQRVDWLEECFQ